MASAHSIWPEFVPSACFSFPAGYSSVPSSDWLRLGDRQGEGAMNRGAMNHSLNPSLRTWKQRSESSIR